MADESRERKEGGGENHGDNAGGDDFQRQNGLNVAIGGVAMDALGVIYGDDALAFVQFNKEVDDKDERDDKTESNIENGGIHGEFEPAEDREGAVRGVAESGAQGGESLGELGDDGGENDKRDAVADSLFGDKFAEPHQNH